MLVSSSKDVIQGSTVDYLFRCTSFPTITHGSNICDMLMSIWLLDYSIYITQTLNYFYIFYTTLL
jgi:hypothetical protein